MTSGVVDSTVLIHILRGNLVAETWSMAQPARLSVTPITWMEVIYGAPSKRVQAATRAVLNRFDMTYLTQADMDWAMQQLLMYRLSHGIAIMAVREGLEFETVIESDAAPLSSLVGKWAVEK